MVGGADVSPLWVVVKSVDREALSKYGTVIQHLMESTPGAKDVTSSLEEKGSEISVEIDKEKMADLGVSLGTVGAVMRTAFSGNTDAKLTSGPFEYDINVVLDELDRRSLADVASIAVPSATGQLVKLSQFAHLSYGTGWTKLERYDRVPSVSIEGQVLGRSSGDVADEIKAKIEALSLPPGVSVAYEGDMKYRADAMGSLGFALLTSIFLVYMIMVALYESYLYPLVVLFSIPLATVGAILALALTNTNLSIFSMLGMIMLVGLVSKNAILVVDFTNHLKRAGHPTAEALLGATRLRLRPVLMTTASMVVGLLPLALASGAAAEWKNGIAWVLIGGLTSSMFLTLIIVPVVYLIADRAKERLGRLLSVAAGPERTPPGRADGAGAPVEGVSRGRSKAQLIWGASGNLQAA
jgi:HAE1 family hydrophobic/amphiphilic exporter-1